MLLAAVTKDVELLLALRDAPELEEPVRVAREARRPRVEIAPADEVDLARAHESGGPRRHHLRVDVGAIAAHDRVDRGRGGSLLEDVPGLPSSRRACWLAQVRVAQRPHPQRRLVRLRACARQASILDLFHLDDANAPTGDSQRRGRRLLLRQRWSRRHRL